MLAVGNRSAITKSLGCDAVQLQLASVSCTFDPNYDQQAQQDDANGSQSQKHPSFSSMLSNTDSPGASEDPSWSGSIAPISAGRTLSGCGRVADDMLRMVLVDAGELNRPSGAGGSPASCWWTAMSSILLRFTALLWILVASLPLAGRHKNVEIIRIGGYSFHRPRLSALLAH